MSRHRILQYCGVAALAIAASLMLAVPAHAQNTATVLTTPKIDTTPNVFRGTTKIASDVADHPTCLAVAIVDSETRPPGDYTYGCEVSRTSFTIRVTAPVLVIPPKPADKRQAGTCPAGTTGSWEQIAGHYRITEAPYWALGGYEPKTAPAGSCTAVVVPPPPPAEPPPPPATGDALVTAFGAKCDGTTNDAAAITAAIAAAKSRGTFVVIPAATCAYGSVLTLDGVKMKGQGDASVLHALNPLQTSIFLRGDGAEVRSLRLAGLVAATRQAAWEATRITAFGARNFVIDSVTVSGSSAAGFQLAQAAGPGRITRNRLTGTLSDAIHMTDRASFIEVEDNVIDSAGDDGIAVVSYRTDGALSHHITARRNVVTNNRWGRGMSVVGGSDVLYEFNQITNSGAYACMYFAQETSYATFGVQRVVAQRNTLKNCGSMSTGHGAVMAYSDGEAPNSDVALIRNDIVQQGQNGIRMYGPQTGMVVNANRITGANPPLTLPTTGVAYTPFTSGLVGHTATVTPPPVEPEPVVPPAGPVAAELPAVTVAFIPAKVTGFSDRRINDSGEMPYRDPDGMGAFRTRCDYSHFGFNDPLVRPGVDGGSHLHVFFGNTGTDAFSTPESIRTTGNSTCRGGTVNRSSYWVPAMIDTSNGRPVRPRNDNDFYYKTGYGLFGQNAAVVPFPMGFRMIAGDSKSRVAQGLAEFICTGSGARGRTMPACQSGTLEMHILFPQCWDGVNLASPDHRSHVVYASGGSCPSTHPVHFPQITTIVKYDVPAGGTAAWRLSSDLSGSPAGSSAHADWMNGWEQEVMNTFVSRVIRQGLSGGSHIIGDGRTIY